MTDTPQDRDRQRFRGKLAESQAAVDRVAAQLESDGFTVVQDAPTSFGPYESRMDEVDHGDLFCQRAGPWHRVEVKQRMLDFTSAQSFPYRTMFVCARHSWDNADPKPALMIYPNRALTHYGWINPDPVAQRWTIERPRDRRYEAMKQETYVIKVQYVNFRPFSTLEPKLPDSKPQQQFSDEEIATWVDEYDKYSV